MHAVYNAPMLIGLLSDTHGRVEPAKAAVRLLQDRGAQHYLHAGDVGAQQVLDVLAGLPLSLVWGNNDFDPGPLETYCRAIGITSLGRFGDFELDGKRFAILHGDDLRLRRNLLDGQQFDYLIQGHTHVPADQRFGRTRLINPGALHRASPKTVALLDTQTDDLRFFEIA